MHPDKHPGRQEEATTQAIVRVNQATDVRTRHVTEVCSLCRVTVMEPGKGGLASLVISCVSGLISVQFATFYAFFWVIMFFFGRIGPRAKEGVTRIRESQFETQINN